MSIPFNLGWLVNMKTITELFDYIVKTDQMQFVCTYKLSQDPLETFFSSVRMSLGCGNNPTTVQFKAAFESLLCNSLNRKVVIYKKLNLKNILSKSIFI